jgi:predicted ATP-binding protein involved in virulence
MTLEVKTLDKQHHNYVQWLGDLSFHKDELSQFEQQLQQLIVRSNKELLPRFEHFQNAFIRQHEVVDELSHEIGVVDQHLISVRDGAQTLVVDRVLDYDQISAKMETFHKLYRDLKSEYLEFLALW